MLWKTPNLFFFAFLIQTAKGDYFLRVQVHAYSNPSQRSADGHLCDLFGNECDNEFFYCVRPLGTLAQSRPVATATVSDRSIESRARQLQCMQPPTPFRSDTNVDAAFVDYSGTTFLGLPNPMEFRINASEWEGIQFYSDVIDIDDPEVDSAFIDSFQLDFSTSVLRASGGRVITSRTYTGIHATDASTTLSFEVVCLPGYIGETCISICTTTNVCANGGTCVQDAQSNNGFTCACAGDFTGEACETVINDCQGVACNGHGTCVDGVRSFTCQCEEGYTGEFCDIIIPDITTLGDIVTAISTADTTTDDSTTSAATTVVTAGDNNSTTLSPTTDTSPADDVTTGDVTTSDVTADDVTTSDVTADDVTTLDANNSTTVSATTNTTPVSTSNGSIPATDDTVTNSTGGGGTTNAVTSNMEQTTDAINIRVLAIIASSSVASLLICIAAVVLLSVCVCLKRQRKHLSSSAKDNVDIAAVENVVYEDVTNVVCDGESIPTVGNIVYGVKTGTRIGGENIPMVENVVYGIRGEGEDLISTTPNPGYVPTQHKSAHKEEEPDSDLVYDYL